MTHRPADPRNPAETRHSLSRRRFLKASGAVAAAAGVATVGVSCLDDDPSDKTIGSERLDEFKEAPITYTNNVPAPPTDPEPDYLGFFSAHEAATVDALVSRILPGDAEDPGAHEAGIMNFIDVKLSAYEGFWEPTYREPPFAEAATGSATGSSNSAPASGRSIMVDPAELERYGFQSMLTPREAYRVGLSSLDGYAMSSAGSKFVDLSDGQQDAIVGALESGDATRFTTPSATGFFKMVRTDVIEGMFGDPAYGGNRDKAGWKLIRYPGAQRGYTVEDMHTETSNREPQSLAELHMYMEGQDIHSTTILPVSSEHQHGSTSVGKGVGR